MAKVQTGIRIEKRLLKVLKATAAYLEMSLGELLEGIIIQSFDGSSPFAPELIGKINEFRDVYGVDFGSEVSHRMPEDRYERVQTGLRMDKTLLKVLKSLAAYLEMSASDLIEGIVLSAFEGDTPFVPKTRSKIAQLASIFGLELRPATWDQPA